jgi:orotate phosphoribosyltransferase-like protein
MRDWERYKKAGELRKKGLTYKEIGEVLGVCMQRAHQMVATQASKERRESYRSDVLSEDSCEQSQ